MFKRLKNWFKNTFGKNSKDECTCKPCACEKSVENKNSAVIDKELIKNDKNLEKTCIDNVKKVEAVEKKHKNENAPVKVKAEKKTEKIEKKVTNKQAQKNQQKVVKESKKKVEKVSAESQQQEKPKRKTVRKKKEEKKD